MDKSGALLLIQHGYAAYAFSHLTYIVLLATFLYYVKEKCPPASNRLTAAIGGLADRGCYSWYLAV